MSGLYLPGEVVPVKVPAASWTTAQGWLYSWVRTDHPGYRLLSSDGRLLTVASGTYRWDDFIVAINTAATAVGGTFDKHRTGYITFGCGTTIVWPDRLGWLLGLGVEAGGSTSGSAQSPYVPPGGIPLLGATWDRVRVEREREIITDRSRRFGGYVFGAARLWSCRLSMTRYGYDALRTGWCLRGKVTIAGSSTTAMAAAVPGGALTGYVLGLEGAPAWSGPTQDTCTVTMLVAAVTT